MNGPDICSSVATCEFNNPLTSSPSALFAVGKDSQRSAYFDDCALVSPMMRCKAAGLPLTYPVPPRSKADMCSVTLSPLTVIVCVPEVFPVSPVAVSVTPCCVAVETKCTPWLAVALIAASYSACTLWFGAPVAPAERGAIPTAASMTSAVPVAAAAVRIWFGHIRGIPSLSWRAPDRRRTAPEQPVGRDILPRPSPRLRSRPGALVRRR